MRFVVVGLLFLALGCSRPVFSGGVRLGPVPLDGVEARRTQAAVDEGHQLWRLQPLEVAKATGPVLGLNPQTDVFRLLRQEGSKADVEVQRAGRTYVIRLGQPVRQGPKGIWVVEAVQAGS